MPDPKINLSADIKAMQKAVESAGKFESEEFGFAQEMAMQYGAIIADDNATEFLISAKDLYVMMLALGYSRKNKIEMVIEKDTKNYHQFAARNDSAHIQSVYVKRDRYKGKPVPEVIEIRIEDGLLD